MATKSVVLVFVIAAVASALPADHVIAKMDPGPRYQYVVGPDGEVLVDLWLKTSDVLAAARYNPEESVGFHLFTQLNRHTSQPIPLGADDVLKASNFDPSKKTVFIVHGWGNTPQSNFNVYMTNYYLIAEDVNLIMVDWSIGAAGNYLTALTNAIRTAEHVAKFIIWLNSSSGADYSCKTSEKF